MKVYATPAQFAKINEETLRMEVTRDPRPLIGILTLCCLENGGDFNPALAQVGETEIVVIST